MCVLWNHNHDNSLSPFTHFVSAHAKKDAFSADKQNYQQNTDNKPMLQSSR